MKIKKLLSVGVLAALLAAGSCSDDYDERFDKLDQQLQDVISQVEGAAELSSAIAALESQITSLKNAVGELPEGDALTGGLSALETQIGELEADLAALAEAGATSEELATLVAGLTSDLDLLQDDLAELLENSNVLTGDLVIFDQNSLDAALSLGDRVAIVNGSLQIIADDLDAEALNAVTSKIVAVTSDMNVQTDKELDFANLETVGDDLTVFGNIVDLSGLRSVGDDLELSWDGDYDLPGLTLVSTNIRLAVDGESPYNIEPCKCAKTSKAKSRIINFLNVKAAGVEVLYGASMSLTGGVYDMDSRWDDIDSELYFPNATSIIFGDVPVDYLVAPVAKTVELHFEGKLDDLLVISTATSTTIKATELGEGSLFVMSYPFSDEVPYGLFENAEDDQQTPQDFINIFPLLRPENWLSAIDLPNLAKVGGEVGLVSQTLTMPMLKEVGEGQNILLTQENVSLPLLQVEGDLYATGAVNVELGSISTTVLDPSILETLKLNAQLNDATGQTIGLYDFPALSSLTILGSTDLEGDDAIDVELFGPKPRLCPDCPVGPIDPNVPIITPPIGPAAKDPIGPINTFDVPVLKTVVLGGTIANARLTALPAMASLTTSGNINDLEVIGNGELVSLTLGHAHFEGENGAVLIVRDNNALETLVTENLDYVYKLNIMDNASLGTIDLSSIKTVVNDLDQMSDWYEEAPGTYTHYIEIRIENNALTGTLEEYEAQSGTTDEKLGVLNSADLYTLKTWMDAIAARAEEDGNDLDEVVSFFLEVDDVDDNGPLAMIINDGYTWTWSSVDGVINFDGDYSFL